MWQLYNFATVDKEPIMNQIVRARCFKTALCLPALILLLACGRSQAQGVVPGRLLVRLAPGTSIVGVILNYGLNLVDSILPLNLYELQVLDPTLESLIEFLLKIDPLVLYCEPEALVASPELHTDPFHLAFDATPNPTGYKNQSAYQQVDMGNNTVTSNSRSRRGYCSGDASVTVAVLDTGVDFTSAPLAGRLLNGYNTLSPRNAPLDVPDGKYNTEVGHGTMIAGLIARVSPSSVIMPIRVFNADGTGTMMHVIEGIYYAVQNDAEVINMSFETNINSLALADALSGAYAQGAVLVASAGNEHSTAPHYPAALKNVIGVASVNSDNTLSTFSNYGVNALLVAPGNLLQSTYWNDKYASWSGTSFAAPFVAAEAAEVLIRNQTWTPAQVTNRMLQTANNVDKLNPGYAKMLGAGIIDIQAAIGGQ